jgi:autotransporter translocation and assembly factor TamB
VRKSSGTLLLNAHIEGTSDNLETAGFLEMQDGAFRFRGYQGNFHEISGKVIFTPGEFEFDNFHGKIDDAGDFSIKGKVLYQARTISEFDVWVDASELTFSKAEYYKVVLAPSLHFTGTPSSPVISGRVQITDGRYIKDVRVERQFVEVQRETAPTRPPSEWLKNLKMNIVILDDGNFRVRNNFADMRIRTDLKVTGSPLSFSVDGYMEGVDGKIFYGGTAFDVVTARLDFSDPLKIDPYVNVFAQTEIRTYQIRLYLKGRLSRMVLTLESSPTLDDQNILSLITFHKLADELTQSEINVLATLPMFFSQLSGNPLATPLEKYTGLNILMIEAQENNPGMRVTVGSDLTKRLRILYSAETSGVAPLHETQAIFKITDNIWLQGIKTIKEFIPSSSTSTSRWNNGKKSLQ